VPTPVVLSSVIFTLTFSNGSSLKEYRKFLLEI